MAFSDYVRVIVKGSERYIFFYDDGEEKGIVGAAQRFADNPKLNFCDYDVDCLAKIVGGECLKT